MNAFPKHVLEFLEIVGAVCIGTFFLKTVAVLFQTFISRGRSVRKYVLVVDGCFANDAQLRKYAKNQEAWAGSFISQLLPNRCFVMFISHSVVTGATDGIGKEFAFQLAAAKYNIVLVSRTQKRLDDMASEIGA